MFVCCQVSCEQQFESRIRQLEEANQQKERIIQQLQATVNSLQVRNSE